MKLERIDGGRAECRLEANDRASGMTSAGANRVYRDDPGLYHLVIDTSAFGLDACVNLIVAAGQLRLHQASATG